MHPSPIRLPAPGFHLAGNGIQLREWTDADAPALSALYDDPLIARWTPVATPFDVATATAFLERARQRRAEDIGVQLAITTDGVRPLGEVQIFRCDPHPDDVELAYAIGRDHRRQGLASRTVTLLAAHARQELGFRRVLLRIEAENAASAAVARASGFGLTEDPPVVRQNRDREALLRTWELQEAS